MRWDSLALDDGPAAAGGGPAPAGPAAAPLLPRGAVTRTFATPEFRGMTFYEVHCRSALNPVPPASRLPFRWTVNPYRGCGHACVYCFARGTHRWLDLDAGHDFDSRVVVKTNVAEVLARELARPGWTGEHVALGTNVDCYQRVEGRYRLMPGVLDALSAARNPFSLLTKGTLVLRDLDRLAAAADVTDVSAALSVGSVDPALWRAVEPGTPAPRRRLEAVRALHEAGIPTGVLMGPVLPFLSDSPAQLEETVRAVAAAGAAYVSPIVLHLRPGAREWWQAWLRGHHPDLLPRYAELYGERAYAPRAYQREVEERVRDLAERHGVGRERVGRWRTGHERALAQRERLRAGAGSAGAPRAAAAQLSLL